jgi:hypothetical protein
MRRCAVILHDVLTDLGIRDLRTFADAWGVEVIRKDDRAEYVEQLRQIKHKLEEPTLVKAKVLFDDLPYRVHMLVRWMLRELLNTPGYQVVIETFHESLIREEQELIEFAKSGRALQNIDRKVTEIYGEVLRALHGVTVRSPGTNTTSSRRCARSSGSLAATIASSRC